MSFTFSSPFPVLSARSLSQKPRRKAPFPLSKLGNPSSLPGFHHTSLRVQKELSLPHVLVTRYQVVGVQLGKLWTIARGIAVHADDVSFLYVH